MRIRKLRKEKKLTLEALAADRLTKGMLSQIENDKAKPSIESLQYIAERLGVEASELLEQINPTSLRNLLEDVESLFTKMKNGNQDNHQQIVDMIEPYVTELPLCYESGRLLYIYAAALNTAGIGTWEPPLIQARAIFKDINLLSHWFETYVLQLGILLENRQYDAAYDCILQAKMESEQDNVQLDSRDASKMSYYIAIMQLAIGEYEAGKKLINESITNAHQNQLYYYIDDMYRIAAYCAMIDGDFKQAEHLLKKLEQYRVFAEHEIVDALIFVLKAHYYSNYLKDYQKALEEIECFKALTHSDSPQIDESFYFAEKGKSLYLLGRYDEAKKAFEQFTNVPAFILHPYDILSMNECISYKALCYAQLGELQPLMKLRKS